MDNGRYIHLRSSKRFLVWSLIVLALFVVVWVVLIAGLTGGSGGLEVGPISK